MKPRLKLFKLFIIFLSFVIAWVLTVMPLPTSLHWIMPEWIALMLIYWALREPDKVGVITGFCIGLFIDVMNGTVLGQHALSMSIIVYLTQLFKHRMPLFPIWHQATVVLVLVGFGQLALLMAQWIMGHPPGSLLFWSSTVTSMLMWPWIYRILRLYERKSFN